MEEHAWQFCCEAGHLHTLIYGAFSKNNGIQNHWILEVPHFLSNLKNRLPTTFLSGFRQDQSADQLTKRYFRLHQ